MFQLEILGRALRWLREDRGLKQEDVAQIAGITRPMLSAYERGRVQPTLDTLDRLLRALDCDLSALSEALKIVTSMGKVGRRRSVEGELAEERGTEEQDSRERLVVAADSIDRSTGEGSHTKRTPFTFENAETAVVPADREEEEAFRELMEVHRRWLVALRRSMIRPVSSSAS